MFRELLSGVRGAHLGGMTIYQQIEMGGDDTGQGGSTGDGR
jgi:hypothetical protein